ncbi:hypothetical protein GPECTOR_152g56 [Gonium pectorale]|uniref:Uncharacterized protein n=1 Tax=Gonium pectorale TaxID=33097 RepID=A0A150FXQ6_GONPE|nr:hypothetical protein GPECTOR_152g56 [Gonium pectorale]|eukprot:KXZ42401.1 hypothetical protein GPECTOR_152g56 [Gonium pectorale]
MHVVLCLLLATVFLGFVFYIYLPLLRRMHKEKRRIAEMMSQLPPELDVMRLVIGALMGPRHAAAHMGGHGHHHHRNTMRRASMMSVGTEDLSVTPGHTGTGAGGGAHNGAGAGGGVAGKDVMRHDGGGGSTTMAGREASVGSAGAGAPGGAGDTKAYQTWKEILARATSLSQAPKGSGGEKEMGHGSGHGAHMGGHGGSNKHSGRF